MQLRKGVDSQFMCKILDIMEKYPDLVKWNPDATQLILADIDKISSIILPEYFRHQNFNSFVRQLNMYDFHKVYKIGRSLSFKNQIFFKGNQHNFYQIQRKKRFKDPNLYQTKFQQECSHLIDKINSLNQITVPMKKIMIQLLEYKHLAIKNIKKLKEQLETLCDQLKQSRNKKILDLCKMLENQIQNKVAQLTTDSMKIDEFIQKQVKSQKKSSCNFSPYANEIYFSPLIANQRVLSNSQSGNMFGLGMNIFSQSLLSKQQNSLNNNQNYNNTKENIKSFKSIPIFLEQIKTRKEAFSIERLYNPFNSQNNMMYLPSYTINHQAETQKIVIQEDHIQGQQQKFVTQEYIDYDDCSSSVSFVKDLNQDQNDLQEQ